VGSNPTSTATLGDVTAGQRPAVRRRSRVLGLSGHEVVTENLSLPRSRSQRDGGHQHHCLPAPSQQSPPAPSGRGLHIVAAVSDAWGVAAIIRVRTAAFIETDTGFAAATHGNARPVPAFRRETDAPLTATQAMILSLISAGRSLPTIAASLDLTDDAVDAHLVTARKTLNASDTSSAIAYARELRLITNTDDAARARRRVPVGLSI
jgi:DNA-binding CsgD family transcriptional regulator